MKIKIVNKSDLEAPKYATEDSAGFDLRANDFYSLMPFKRLLVKTGLFIEIPKGHVGYVCTRSGLALKQGLMVLNSPGVVDSDYRSEVGVILINLSDEQITVKPGDRIAQMIISSYTKAEFDVVASEDEFSKTGRGLGGFGSTGTK